MITGGGGILCSHIAEGLARERVRVALLDIAEDKAEAALERVRRAGSDGLAIKTDVLSRDSLNAAAEEVISTFGKVDFLINGAGGNHPKATTSEEVSFFELPEEGVRFVLDLNFMGTFLASQIFGRVMAER
ncbi:MAG: SDR family NAD(P)-dependent oxidoreductase, partial [Armatimonadetes bacterium]|nr:SDR family NAD(P)-dependent oxidoreductase [Armatimonadota bacterium]